VLHIYIYIYIYDISRLRVNDINWWCITLPVGFKRLIVSPTSVCQTWSHLQQLTVLFHRLPFPLLLGLTSPTILSASSSLLNLSSPNVFLTSSISPKVFSYPDLNRLNYMPLGRSLCRRGNNIKTDLQEVRYGA